MYTLGFCGDIDCSSDTDTESYSRVFSLPVAKTALALSQLTVARLTPS
jgi:hypothetical protein